MGDSHAPISAMNFFPRSPSIRQSLTDKQCDGRLLENIPDTDGPLREESIPSHREARIITMCRGEIGRRTCEDIHLACQDRNCSVGTIRKLIDEAGVEVLEKKDVFGRVPLFYAIRRNCSLTVIQTLFDANQDAILQPDFCGDLPLYMLFRPRTDSRILEYVLHKNPSLAVFREKRFSGSQTLLQTLCAQWVDVRNKELYSAEATTSQSENTNSVGDEYVLTPSKVRSDRALLDRWTKLVLTIRAFSRIAHGRTEIGPRSSEIPELHLALQLQCSLPRAVVGQFIEMYPEQAATRMKIFGVGATDGMHSDNAQGISAHDDGRNSTGNSTRDNTSTSSDNNHNVLPLHYYLSEYCHSRTETTNAVPNRNPRTPSGNRFAPVHEQECLLKSLVRAFPPAASVEHGHGDTRQKQHHHHLPLHTAIASRISWETGLQELVYAHPSALGIPDQLGTHLIPVLQQASIAASGHQCHIAALTTTYCLLREDPSVLATRMGNHHP